jgi:hypothetical protein
MLEATRCAVYIKISCSLDLATEQRYNFIHNNVDMLLIIDVRLKVLCFNPPNGGKSKRKGNQVSENPLLLCIDVLSVPMSVYYEN